MNKPNTKLDANALAALLLTRLTVDEVKQALANNGYGDTDDIVRVRYAKGYSYGNGMQARYEVDLRGDDPDGTVYVRWDEHTGSFKAEF